MTPDQLIAFSDELASLLVPMPAAGPDVCPHCHTCKDDQWPSCYSCGRVLAAVDHPCANVIPISFYMRPAEGAPASPLREALHDYKEHDDATVRDAAAMTIAAILARYYMENAAQLEARFGPWSDLVAVPSTKRPNPSGLVVALSEAFSDIIPTPAPLLAPGPGHKERNAPDPTAFVTTGSVTGKRILLVDDTFTTGSALHSAAAALADAGASVVAGIVIGRKINPDPKWANSMEVWERQVANGFRFTDPPYWALDA